MEDRDHNLNQVVLVAFAAYAQRTCLRVKRGTQYRPVRFREVEELALRVAYFLREHAVAPGDRVALAADSSVEWLATYLGCLLHGAVAVPLRPSTPASDKCFMLRDSEAKVVLLHDESQLAEVAENLGDLPCLQHGLLVGSGASSELTTTRFATVRNESLSAADLAALRTAAEAIAPDALASIQYTAQETGRPRGAIFEHRQRVEALRLLGDWMSFDPDDLAFSVLPWAYAPSLQFSLRCLISGVPIVLAEGRDQAFENMRQTSPTVAMVTPYGLERFYNQVMGTVGRLSRSRRDVFRWALSIGREYRAAGAAGTAELREGFARADRTFFSQIRAELGGRLARIYSVGAPLPPHVAEFAEAIGLEPLSLYSLTEAGGFPTINRPGGRCPGTCGQVSAGYQIRIADDDEVLVRGSAVMRGYWRRPEPGAQVLESDGWLHTGDLGRFDQEGNLHLIGHKESLFVLSTGRTVMPNSVENELIADPLVARAVVFGEGRPYVTALILPDLTAVATQLQELSIELAAPELVPSHPRVRELFEKLRENLNQRLDTWERVERLHVLDEPLSESAGELSVSLGLNRQVIAERFAAEIDAMYPRPALFAEQEITQVQLEPEQLQELFESQDILDAWMADAGIEFLFDLARLQRIHPPSMVHICETAAAVAQMQSEERPLSTALIVGDLARIGRILPESEIQLQRYDHIRRMRQVVITLAEMVDGLVLGFVLDQHGYVRGIHKLDVQLEDPRPDDTSYLFGPQFRHHMAISRLCGAMVFFVPNGGRQVRVFSKGRLIGRYANGNWSSESMDHVDRSLRRLVGEGSGDLDLLRRLLRCAFRMSEDNLGAIFMFGDADLIMQRSDPPAVSAFASIVSAPLDQLTDAELINFARQDGATVIDSNGRFRSCKVLLRPAAETRADIRPDQGARHSSAAKMSAEADCLAICVSQDGPITGYQSGKRVFSL
ncbi:MAG: AMP-binding protein [Acidobacteriota bacterium]